jgi:hypothetical protein
MQYHSCMQHRSLEKHTWFPYLAWTTVLSFALFVGNLTLQLQQELHVLDTYATATETALTNW